MTMRGMLVLTMTVGCGLLAAPKTEATSGNLVAIDGRCLTVLGDGSAVATNTGLEDCTPANPAQLWTAPSTDSFELIRGLADKCINASGNGIDLILYPCQVGSTNDIWMRTATDPFELIVGPPDAPLWHRNKCADATDPTRVQYRTCDGSVGQLWSFEAPTRPAVNGITSPLLPGYRFWGRISGNRIATSVTACTGETVCLAGAIATRAEVFVRIVGPKPNGFLWPNIVKFNTTATEIWIEQISTGQVNYYYLPALASESSTLPGLVDKTGFTP